MKTTDIWSHDDSRALPKESGQLILLTMEADQELKSLKRGLKTMLLMNERGTLAISDLSRALSLPRTTAERVLKTLFAEGFVGRDPQTKRFFLTDRVSALSGGYTDESWITDVARPFLFEMTREVGWPLCIATADGEYTKLEFTTDPVTSLNIHQRRMGYRISMARASSGIVHLAFIAAPQRRIMLEMLYGLDDEEILAGCSPTEVEYAIAQAREHGYSFGLDLGRERSLSVPIFHDGQIKASLALIFIARGLSHEHAVERFVPRLKTMALEIERRAFG